MSSRFQSPDGKRHATLVGIPKNHLAAIERALRAAKLRPISLTMGIAALQPPGVETSNGVMALAIGESNVGLQVTTGGGVAALRALDPTVKVLFMSGYSDDALVSRGISVHGMDFIGKPFTQDALSRKVRGVLESTAAKPGADEERGLTGVK